jgi:hypothetical protein
MVVRRYLLGGSRMACCRAPACVCAVTCSSVGPTAVGQAAAKSNDPMCGLLFIGAEPRKRIFGSVGGLWARVAAAAQRTSMITCIDHLRQKGGSPR